MGPVQVIAYWALTVYFYVLIARMIFDWIQILKPRFKPAGALLLLAEVIYTVTDPPLKWLRGYLKPLRVGPLALDTAFLVLFVLVAAARVLVL